MVDLHYPPKPSQSNPLRRGNVDLMFLRLSRRFGGLDEQTQRIITALLETRGKGYQENRIEFQGQTITPPNC